MGLRLTSEQLDIFNSLSHLPKLIAGKIMARRIHCHSEVEDATQEGLMALAKAIREFQPGSTQSLEQFAAYRIRARIIDAHRERFGRHQGTERFRFHSKLVSIDAMAERRPSKSPGRGAAGPTQFPDRRSDSDFAKADDRDEIDRMFRGLTPLQAQVLTHYYREDMKVSEIAEKIGKCQARVFQIISHAVNYLRRRCRTYEHVEGISRRTGAPVRIYRRLGVLRGDGTVATLRQYADESGIVLRRVHKLAASGKLKTVPFEEMDNDNLLAADRDSCADSNLRHPARRVAAVA